jgi:hypothetical protein
MTGILHSGDLGFALLHNVVHCLELSFFQMFQRYSLGFCLFFFSFGISLLAGNVSSDYLALY